MSFEGEISVKDEIVQFLSDKLFLPILSLILQFKGI